MIGHEEREIGNTLDEWDEKVHPDDKKQCYAELEKHFRRESPFYEKGYRILCKDGSYKWILDRGKVLGTIQLPPRMGMRVSGSFKLVRMKLTW
jgi:PAS domain-containing protein